MTSRLLLLELVWWITTAVIVVTVMFPIWSVFPDFRFTPINVLYIVAAVTFTRYTFLLKYTFLATWQKVKIAFVLLTLGIVGFLVVNMQDFNVWLDNSDPNILLASVEPPAKREPLLSYIRSEFIFFAVASIVAAVFLSGRLLISVWRLPNRGKA
jgi:hypothetical protein